MSDGRLDPDDAEEPFGRPFLDRPGGAPAQEPRPAGPPRPQRDDDVRPYVVTGGRTRATGSTPAVEAMVRTTARGAHAEAEFETARMLELCGRAQSIAEISAHLAVPIGVVRVLAADLVAAGFLEVRAPTSANLAMDPTFLERLMSGVAAL